MQSETRAKEIYEILDNMQLDNGMALGDKVSPEVIYQIVVELNSKLPMNNLEKVVHFNKTFGVPVDKGEVLKFTQSKLRYELILEETLELAFAFGIERAEVYVTFAQILGKVYNKPIPENDTERKIEVFDALLDLLVVVYGGFYIADMIEAVEDGMDEVYVSNMSKIINSKEELIATIEKYKKEGINLVSEELDNKHFIVKHKDTGKILKSISFKQPKLVDVLKRHNII